MTGGERARVRAALRAALQADEKPGGGNLVALPSRTRMRASVAKRGTFAPIPREMIPAFSRLYGTALGLHLEMLLLSGSNWVGKRQGWIPMHAEVLREAGLQNSGTRSKAVARLCAEGVMEVRNTGGDGRRLEYRLNPNWGKLKAKVVDLGKMRGRK